MSERPAALVTGGAIRMGKAIVLALANAGYDIAIHYNSSSAPAAATKQAVTALGVDCEIFQLDLRAVDDYSNLFAAVTMRFPRLAVLVNNASSYNQAPIAETTPDVFDTEFAVNLRAPFFLTQQFAAHVEQGSVVNILDNKIGFNQFQYAAYLLAKKTLAEFTRMAALEYAPRLRVNGVAPGVVLPAAVRSPEYVAWRVQGIPLQVQGETTHITKAIISLLDNRFITGQILVVDGGENIRHVGQNAADYPGDSDGS